MSLFAVGAFFVIALHIGRSVRTVSESAKAQYGGDCVGALISCFEDSRATLRERNRAVWALGQLGDRRALPVLRAHHTGQPCAHAHALCQRELGKAIELIDGGVNATAWIWRRGTIP